MAQKSIKTSGKPAPKVQQQQRRPEGKISRWWRETVGELRKVNWPTLPEARRLTWIVLVVMLATSALLGLFDFIFSRLLAFLFA